MSLLRTDLPTEIIDQLRRLDPVPPGNVMTDVELERMAMDLLEQHGSAPLDLTPGAHLSHGSNLGHGSDLGHGRRRVWVPAVAAVSVVVIAVVATVIGVRRADDSPSTGRAGVAGVGTIPAAYRALAATTNPLSADMDVDCNGVVVPVPMLAAPGGAERGSSASSVALRRFLAHNPFAGMGSVTSKNWLLLSRTDKALTFGQREGRIGIGTVVTLTRKGSSYDASAEGGCGPVSPGGQESGEPVGATVHGSQLFLQWMNGTNCGTGPAKTARTVARVLLRQTATAVHVLLISQPSPDAGPQPANQACLGVGLRSQTSVRLQAPMGNRVLIDDSRVPGATVTLRH